MKRDGSSQAAPVRALPAFHPHHLEHPSGGESGTARVFVHGREAAGVSYLLRVLLVSCSGSVNSEATVQCS